MPIASVARFTLFSTLLLMATTGLARADVVETKDGARLVGHVTKIDDGKVCLETRYAGTIVVALAQVVSVTTDAPVAVRLEDGRRLEGRLSVTNGKLAVDTTAGAVATKVESIAESWSEEKGGPPSAKSRAHWAYEASIDLNGKTGNRNQLGSAYGVTATMVRLNQKLVLRTSYSRQMTEGVVSADQFKAGADFSDNYSDKNSWYARDEGGFDRIRDVAAYNTAAVGRGYDFIKELRQTLTGRLGVAFRYENYFDDTAPDIRTVGLDIGANYSLRMESALLSSRVEVVPTFQGMTNVHITHETDLDLPLAKSAWKMRVGVSNDYSNRPADALERLDTTYFGRLVLSWK